MLSVGGIEQSGQTVHMAGSGHIRKSGIGGFAHLLVRSLQQCEDAVRGHGHAACGGQPEGRNEHLGVITRKQPLDHRVDAAVEGKQGFLGGFGMGTFERRDQRCERLLAADTARSFDGGPCDPVVGRSHGARNHTALRHGAAVTQPREHRSPGFGVIARHAGGNPRKDLVVALAERLQSGIAVFGRSLLDGGQYVRHRLFGTERIGKYCESRTTHILAVALEQALGGFHGRLGVSRGHEVRKQAQIGIGSAGVIPAVTGLGGCGGQRFERSARTADSQRIVNLFGRPGVGAAEPSQQEGFGLRHPLFGKSIGQRAFPFGRKALLAGLGEQNRLGAGRRNQRTDRIVGQIGVVQIRQYPCRVLRRGAELQLREEESAVGVVGAAFDRPNQSLADIGAQGFVSGGGRIGSDAVQGVFERRVLTLVGGSEHAGDHFDTGASRSGKFAHHFVENGGRGGRKLGQTVGNDGLGVALPGVELLGGNPCGQQGDQGAQNKQSCDYLFHGNRC